MKTPIHLTRRRLLTATLGSAALGVLAACGEDTPPPAPTVEATASPPSAPLSTEAQAANQAAEPIPASGPPAGTRLPDIAARVRQAQGDVGILPPAPATASDSPIEVPADILAARAERLISLSDRDQLSATAWRNIGWKTDFETSLVHFDEIFSGGVPRDGIPPIDNPKFTDFAEAVQFVAGREPVVALRVNGETRAYPLQILTYHEIVNDVIGGRPVAVTFCPLCNSSVVFDRQVFGSVLRFGVSGNLRNSDLIMWDDVTETWWQQLTGEGLVGHLAGITLDFVPSQLISFDEFKAAFRDGRVLSQDTGFSRPYGRNPYGGYDTVDDRPFQSDGRLEERPFLFQGRLDTRFRATERVVALEINGEAVAYPFSVLSQQRVVNDSVGGEKIVVLWTPNTVSALDKSDIATSTAVGSGVAYGRVVDGRELTFVVKDDVFTDQETGSTWDVTGRALSGPLAGAELPPLVHANHFWFAWAAFRPATRVFTATPGS